jgi:hypothetical protein
MMADLFQIYNKGITVFRNGRFLRTAGAKPFDNHLAAPAVYL